MKYKAIIYDIDGTLVDTFAQNIYPLQRLVEELTGDFIHYDDLVHFSHYNGIEVLPHLGIDASHYSTWVQYVNEYQHPIEAYDGIIEVLDHFHGKVPQAVVSSKRRKQYNIDMGLLDMKKYFEVSVMVDEIDLPKPNPQPLLKALEMLDIKPEEAIYIGDSPYDYIASKAAGMDFGLAGWGALDTKDMTDIDYTFEHPSDIIKLLK